MARDYGREEIVEAAHQAAIDRLRQELAKREGTTENTVNMSDEEVADAAVAGGLFSRDELEELYIRKHPEVDPANEDRPSGLDTQPAAEMSNYELLVGRIDHELAIAEGLDPDSPVDLATQANYVMAAGYAHEREMAENLVARRFDVEDPSKLSDERLVELVEEERLKTILNATKSGHDLETIVAQKRGETINHLVEEYGFDRADLDGLSLGELNDRWAEAQEQAAWRAEAEAEVAHRTDVINPSTLTDAELRALLDEEAKNQQAEADAQSDTSGGADSAAAGAVVPGDDHDPEAGTQQDTRDPGYDYGNDLYEDRDRSGDSTDLDDDATLTGYVGYGDVVYLDNGAYYEPRSDGTWVTPWGVKVEDPVLIDELNAIWDRDVGGGATVERPSMDDQSEVPSDVESSEAEDGQSSEDDSGSDDDDEEDDEGTADDAAAAEGEDEQGEDDESGDSESSAGTPHPDGDVPIDPADQARFDESPFGEAQRQAQIDAIEDRSGTAGAPEDDPSGLDDPDFLDTPVGEAMMADVIDGMAMKADGGDTDPLDIDAEESNGEVVELKLQGGGVVDPVDDDTGTTGPRLPTVPDDPTGGTPGGPGVPGGDRLGNEGDPDDPTDPEGAMLTTGVAEAEMAGRAELAGDIDGARFGVEDVVVEPAAEIEALD
ncbi:MAG: hypothetical protein AAGD18_10360 [Actinomycetota bacterium]